MNATQAENLRILIRHMETNCFRILNMSSVHVCGTPACALGEAVFAVPALRDQFIEGGPYMPHRERIFGVTNELFGGGMIVEGKWLTSISPGQWATKARAVLVAHGYGMDDGFAAFMAKVREPVPLESAVLVQGLEK